MKRMRCLLVLLLCSVALAMQAQQREHVVQRGEDFASIAKKYAITEQELMDANPSSKACYAGRKLIIPKHGVPVERKAVTPEPLDIKLLSDDNAILTKNAATTYQVGHSLWKKGKYDEAVKYLLSAVEQGDPRAYYPLGECYAQKDAKCHDDGKAVECYTKAVENVRNKYDESYWMASGNLAKCYIQGIGVAKDLKKAEQYAHDYQRYADVDMIADAGKVLDDVNARRREMAQQLSTSGKSSSSQSMAQKQVKGRKRTNQQFQDAAAFGFNGVVAECEEEIEKEAGKDVFLGALLCPKESFKGDYYKFNEEGEKIEDYSSSGEVIINKKYDANKRLQEYTIVSLGEEYTHKLEYGKYYVEGLHKYIDVIKKETIMVDGVADVINYTYSPFSNDKSRIASTHGYFEILKHRNGKIEEYLRSNIDDKGNWLTSVKESNDGFIYTTTRKIRYYSK